jgi:hypothetical protein
MHTLRVMLILPLLLLFASCGVLPPNITSNPGEPTLDVGQIVQATFQALTAQAGQQPTPMAVAGVPTNTGAPGAISGSLNYPADSLPPMYVTAYQVGTQNYHFVTTQAGQGTFLIDRLPAGTYHVVAYTVEGGGFPAGLAGGYTKAVPCGLATECADHSLIDVSVAAGQTATGVKAYDWNAPAGTFPPFPQRTALTGVPLGIDTLPPPVAEGSIAGNLMYPASALPALRIVAFQAGSTAYYFTDTTLGQSSYQLDHVPAGTYHVVAYVLPGGGFSAGLAGGYSQMVPCGLKSGCNDHTLIDVVVTPAHVTTGVDPNDYYADAGTFPPDPVP